MSDWRKKDGHWCNLGWLIEHYNLDIEELYFDADGNCIRDKEGNIWYD